MITEPIGEVWHRFILWEMSMSQM